MIFAGERFRRLAIPGKRRDNGRVDRLSLARLIEEHRAIETRLDRLSEAIRSGMIEAAAVRELMAPLERHYAAEEGMLAELGNAKLEAKLKGQHAEALEIGGRLLESLEGGYSSDAEYLSRRLVAITQHSIIEEERDVFPLFR
jgi:hypothetical protein